MAVSCNRVPTMSVGNERVEIEIAQTPDARNQGLSGRESLGENSGMLFIFESPDAYGFWMKDMKFPLDFIWIKDGKVIEITPNVGFRDQTTIYTPKSAVDSVLEVNAGWASKNGIKVGDQAIVD